MSPQPPPQPPPSLPPSSKSDSSENDFADEPPWLDFIDIPKSIIDFKNRFNKNIIHFQIIYLTIVICIFYLFLCLFAFTATFDSGFGFTLFYVISMPILHRFVTTTRSTPLEFNVLGFMFIFHRIYGLGLMLVIAVFPFALLQAWVHLIVFFSVSSAIVGLHAILAPTREYDGVLFVFLFGRSVLFAEPSDIV